MISSSVDPCHFVGFDLGTSGARMSIVEEVRGVEDSGEQCYREIHSDSIQWDESNPYDCPKAWARAMETLLKNVSNNDSNSNSVDGDSSSLTLRHVKAMCVSGTSASCLLLQSKTGEVTRAPRMYNYDILSSSSDNDDASGIRALNLLEECAPDRHTARATTSSLAKLLQWNEQRPLQRGERLCHQSDYMANVLLYGNARVNCGSQQTRLVTSDWHNCLKLGYDVQNLRWPDWLSTTLLKKAGIQEGANVLPSHVVSPGQPIGTLSEYYSNNADFGLPEDTVIVAGTTDSNAAFLAAMGNVDTQQVPYGTAVTSLGSTLAIKQLSQTFVEDATRGVYSHRFPSPQMDDSDEARTTASASWLIGGASNVGCAVLRQENFSNEELEQLSTQIDPTSSTTLDYYPLLDNGKGERFPIADATKQPVLTPKPSDRKTYLHGILQGITKVERLGFQALGDLGAKPSWPTAVYTAGGGSKNDMWLQMRERDLNSVTSTKDDDDDGDTLVVRVQRARNTEASFGVAVLAASTFANK